ncbi:MAG: ABC transporter ATP-binding protein [Culicoidibacterales bacterium]
MKKIFSKRLLFFYAVLLPIAAFQNPFQALMFKQIFDLFETRAVETIPQLVIVTVGGMLLISIAIILFNMIVERFLADIMITKKRQVFQSVLNSDGLLEEKNTTTYLSTLLNDMKVVRSNYYEAIFRIILNSVIFTISLLLVIWLDVTMGLLIVAVFIIPMILPQAIQKVISKYSQRWSEASELYTQKIRDAFSGIDTIRGYRLEQQIERDVDVYNQRVERSFSFLNMWRRATDSTVGFVAIGGFILVNLYGIVEAINGNMTLGTVLAVLQLSNSVLNPALEILEDYNQMTAAKQLKVKVDEIVSTPTTLETVSQKPFTFTNSLCLQNISCTLGEKQVLKAIDLTIKKGEKVLITGPSGSGKTTLLKLLQKRITDFEGEILYDGQNLQHHETAHYLQAVAMINQKPFIFDETLHYNLTFGEAYAETTLVEAYTKAGLGDVVAEKGIDYLVGEDGKNLSGGQRQRLEIARAFLRQQQLLFMDEATSALDHDTAQAIAQATLADAELTVIEVAHHVPKAQLSLYDKIVVLTEGAIFEVGSYEQLLKQPHSYLRTFG